MVVVGVLVHLLAQPAMVHCLLPPVAWLQPRVQAMLPKVGVGPKWHIIHFQPSHKHAYSIKSNRSPSCSWMSTTVFEGLCTTKLLYGCQFMLVRLRLLLLTVSNKVVPPSGSLGTLGGVQMSNGSLANGAGLHVGCKKGATLRRVGESTCCRYRSKCGQLQSASFTSGGVDGGGVFKKVGLTSPA